MKKLSVKENKNRMFNRKKEKIKWIIESYELDNYNLKVKIFNERNFEDEFEINKEDFKYALDYILNKKND